jgi:hypothetical protein
MDDAKKISDIELECPYCNGKNYVSPPFSFFQDAIGKALSDPSMAIQASMKMGELEGEVEAALEAGDIQTAIKKKGESILYSFSFMPHLQGAGQQDAFEIEMHGFKMEFLDDHGKELHKTYFDAAKGQDLRVAAEALLALKNHRLKGCTADSEMVKATRKGIVDSARYYVNGFDAPQEEKQKVIADLGLDKGLIKVGDSFVCPYCAGEIKTASVLELTECPYCNNVFQQSGLDTLSKLI